MQNCAIVETGPKFAFTADSAKLAAAIQKVVTVTSFSNCSDSERQHMIISYKKNLFVVGYSPETFIIMHVTGVVATKDGSCGFSPTILMGLIKNRKELEFSFESNRLYFSATKGKYKGDITTTAVSRDQMPYLERMMKAKSKSGGSLSGEMLDHIRTAVKYVDLKDFYNNSQILCAIRLRKGVLEVTSHDNFHMAFYKSKYADKKASFEMAIPVTTFKLIDKFVKDEGGDVEFYPDDKQFKLVGSSYVVSLPPLQVEDDFYDRVPGFIKSLKNPAVEMNFNISGIKTVDNMFSIADEESKLALTVTDKGKVAIKLSNDHGTVDDAFKSDNTKVNIGSKMSFMIDPRIFGDLFNKVRDREEVPMRLYSKKNKGVSSAFQIAASGEDYKLWLVGTYYED